MTSSSHRPKSPFDSAATSLGFLRAIKANEADAWERLVALYAPLVYRWCQKLNLPEQDISDVFQEVFQAVAAKISTFHKERPEDTFRGWLRVITRNKVYDHFRRAVQEPPGAGGTEAMLRFALLSEPDEPNEPDGDDAADEDLHEHEILMQRALETIRSEFAPRTWQAFWRVAVDGQRPVDVAHELNMQPGAVRVAKSRVLQRLRLELSKWS